MNYSKYFAFIMLAVCVGASCGAMEHVQPDDECVDNNNKLLLNAEKPREQISFITDDGCALKAFKDDVAFASTYISRMLEDINSVKMQVDGISVPVPVISGEILKKIIALLPVRKYCDHLDRYGLWSKHRSDINKSLNACTIEQLQHVIFAANFLEIPELVEYAEAAFVLKCADVDENQFNKLTEDEKERVVGDIASRVQNIIKNRFPGLKAFFPNLFQ